MLSMSDIINRTSPPVPWSEGDNIPWDDPEFSSRMLAEHLSQDHDLASRRNEKIDGHLARLIADLPPAPARILDLACGPGLYLNRLGAVGYAGVGIDFSPASIEHARATAHDLDVTYRRSDLRSADFGSGFHAVLLLYGQLNVFRRSEARSILERAYAALEPGGVLVLEPQTFEHIVTAAERGPSWSTAAEGLFSPQPHLLLTESFWHEATRTSTERFWVVDAATGVITRHAFSNEAYTEEELTAMLGDCGFVSVAHRDSLGDEAEEGLAVVRAEKP